MPCTQRPGTAYTAPAVYTSDSVLAFDIDTGEILWAQQATPDDAFLVGCGPRGPENCPDRRGSRRRLREFRDSADVGWIGRNILVLGQKSGVAWGLDPDRGGEVVWQQRVGQESAVVGMQWGSAADAELGYFPVSELLHGTDTGGLSALRLDTRSQVLAHSTPGRRVPTGNLSVRPCTVGGDQRHSGGRVFQDGRWDDAGLLDR